MTTFTLSFLAVGVLQAEPCLDFAHGGIQKHPQECNVYFYPGLTAYSDKTGSNPVWVSKESRISVLSEEEKKQKSQEWINFSDGSSNGDLWIKTSKLLFYEDFKKVNTCFPIKSIDEGSEFSSIGFLFDEKGKGVLNSSSVWHAYYAKNMYALRVENVDACIKHCNAAVNADSCFCEERVYYVDFEKKIVVGGDPAEGPKPKVQWRTKGELQWCHPK